MKGQVGEEVLQFPLPHRELANISSTEKHGKHCGPLTRYPGVGDDKQLNHTVPKFCKAQHSKELIFHGLRNDAHLSLETP
jgi:hypothetical protein